MTTKHLMPEKDDESSVYKEYKEKARKEFAGLSLEDLVQRFKDGYARKEEAEAELAKVNAFFDVLRFEVIPDKMDEKGITSMNFTGIGRLGLTADMSLRMVDKKGAFTWMKKNKLGALITQTINSSSLKTWYKDRLRAGKSVPPAELIKVTPITRASITKA